MKTKKLSVLKCCFLLFTFCLSLFKSQAQTFQWGIRGGSTDIMQYEYESVYDMATDKAGNVYALSIVGQTSLNVDGHPKTGYGGHDILLSSFTCDGTYRWSKDIGGYTDDEALAVKTDTIGGVYIAGKMYLFDVYGGHIDTDTTLSSVRQEQFLLKFDTAGNYKWFTMPQADTVGAVSYANTRSIDISVDGAGNIYWLLLLPPGAYINGAYTVNTFGGVYVFKYNTYGTFLSATPFDIQTDYSASAGLRMARNANSGKYFLAGDLSTGLLTLGSQPITKTMYVSAFSSTGQALWVKQNASVNSQLIGRQALDANSNMYITGSVFDNDTICGLTMTGSSIYGNNQSPFVIAIDSNGNGIWVKTATVNGVTQGDALTMRNNDEVVMSGTFPGHVSWPGYADTLNSLPNYGYDVFTTRFNSHTGQVLGMDTIASDFGENEEPSAMTADSKGNVYIGGEFVSQMYIANDTLQSIGGETDFFVAKYGFANCTCTATPTANYSYATAGGGTVNFTYTGATPYDSLQWSFGDGGTAATANPSHTYTTTTGTYYACVTVFNSCGSGTYCDTVRPGLGIMPLNGMDNISVYPNPGSDAIYIKGLTGQTDYVMQNTIGVTVSRGILTPASNVIGMQGLAPGVYLLQLTDKDGQQKVIRLVKE